MANKIQLRRDTASAWTNVNPVLSDGEIGYERDSGKFKIGNGIDNWNTLSYFASGGGAITIDGYNIEEDEAESYKRLTHTISRVLGIEEYTEDETYYYEEYRVSSSGLDAEYYESNDDTGNWDSYNSYTDSYAIEGSESGSNGVDSEYSRSYELSSNSMIGQRTTSDSNGDVFERFEQSVNEVTGFERIDDVETRNYTLDHNGVRGKQDNNTMYELSSAGLKFGAQDDTIVVNAPEDSGTMATQEWVEDNASVTIDGFSLTEGNSKLEYTIDGLSFRNGNNIGADVLHNKIVFDDDSSPVELFKPPNSGVIATHEWVNTHVPPVEIGSVSPADIAPVVDGVYRASEAGEYDNLDTGLVAKVGFVTWFKRNSGDWTFYNEVEVTTSSTDEIDKVLYSFLPIRNVTNEGTLGSIGAIDMSINVDSSCRYYIVPLVNGIVNITYKGYRAVSSNPSNYASLAVRLDDNSVITLLNSVLWSDTQFITDEKFNIPSNTIELIVSWSNYDVAEDSEIELTIEYNSKGKDAVKNYIDRLRPEGVVFFPEDYGAERIDPRNPDDSIDSTDAFNDMLYDMFNNYPTSNSYCVMMSGVYRIGGEPIYNNNRSQLNVPFFSGVDWNFKSITFKGITRPSQTDRGDNLEMNPMLGSGFYCSYILTAPVSKAIMYVDPGSSFGLRVGHVHMDNISAYIKTHDDDNESIENNMGCFDFSNLSSFTFTDLYLAVSTAGLNTAEQSIHSVGLYPSKVNNIASVYGNSIKTLGFGIGAVLTEHMNVGHVVAVFNKIGLYIQNNYPINIGNATLEHNNTHVELTDNALVNFGVFQTEDINDPSKWFNLDGDMVKGTGKFTANIIISHLWGGAQTPTTFGSSVTYRYLMDEYGNAKLT